MAVHQRDTQTLSGVSGVWEIMYNKYKTKWQNGKQYRVHRLIMQQHLGRELNRNELVHHVDGDINNNDISNLQIVSRSQHVKQHSFGELTRFKQKHSLSKELLSGLYQIQRLSIHKIAKMLGASPMTIWRNLKKHGINTRSHKEAAQAS